MLKKIGLTSLFALALAARAGFRSVLAALGSVFGGRNACISARLGCVRAFGAYFVRRQQNTVKTVSGSTSELSRDKTKTIKNRLPNAFARARRHERAWSLLPCATRASQKRSEDVLGGVLGCPDAAKSALGPSRACLGALLGGLGRVCRRPLSDLDRSKPPKIAPKSIFGWFWARFSEFGVRSSHILQVDMHNCWPFLGVFYPAL